MATRYVREATKQISPVYDASIQAQQAQIPAIQQLYSTLTQGLQQQNEAQLQSGVQGIVEDASARGVLRSTLPVDARQALTAQLGTALNEGMGRLGVQQAQDIGGVRGNIANLGIERVKGIQDLAGALQQRRLQERQFALQRLQADREFALDKRRLAMSGGGGGGGGGRVPQWQMNQGALSAMAQDIAKNKDLKYKSDQGTGLLSPENYKAYKRKWMAGGFSGKLFDESFSHLANPTHLGDYGLK